MELTHRVVRFVLVPGLAVDDNLIELDLCPLVITRKISGSSRSGDGTRMRLALFSLMHTCGKYLNSFHQCLALPEQFTSKALL
ncbi:MAG: hypothetical protein GX600_07375 [Dehalococcoidia bacterium]|nr:hypothetical protein [Dehalococcoidia bacterium]